MSLTSRIPARAIAGAMLAVLTAALGACSSFEQGTRGIADALTLYKPEVVQGNFVSKEQVAALQPGMSRVQVRDTLGTPLVTSVFHADRWDYVFTMRRQRVEPQNFRLTVFFKGDALERFEGDEMPSETEFVQRISRAGDAAHATASGARAPRACRSAWSTDRCARAASAPRAGPRRGSADASRRHGAACAATTAS